MKNMKRIICFVCILLLSVSFFGCKKKQNDNPQPTASPAADSYTKFKDEQTGSYGFKNSNGDVVVEAQFDRVEKFSEGYAIVWKNKRAGYINSNGELICDYQFVEAGNFSNERAVVRKDSKYGYIDTNGAVAVDFIFDNATSFNDKGIANVILNGEEIWIDKSGNTVNYDDYYPDEATSAENEQNSESTSESENNQTVENQ